MNFLLQYIQAKLLEKGIEKYDLSVQLVQVAISSTETIAADNDFRFLANAFAQKSDPIDGVIKSANAALNLTPLMINTEYYKHNNLYHGKVEITNNSTSDILYVELLVATPLKR